MEKNILWEPTGNVCAFSGYRPSKLPFSSESDPACVLLKQRLTDEIYASVQQGYTDFVCGMALGTDTWAAEAVLEIQQTLTEIKPIRLHAYLPCPEQDQRWNARSRRRYRAILNRCDSITVVSAKYLPDCMERRNRAMIHRAEKLIAVFDGKSGGTKKTVQMAHEKGIEIRILSPIPPQYEPPLSSDGVTEADGQIKLFF